MNTKPWTWNPCISGLSVFFFYCCEWHSKAKGVWGYLSTVMINHFSLILWLPIPGGDQHMALLSLLTLTLSTRMARLGSQREQVPIKSKAIHETEGWDWNRGPYGDGKVMLRRSGEETWELLPLKSWKEFLFSLFLLLASWVSDTTWPSNPLPEFYVLAFRLCSKTYGVLCLIKIILFLLPF